jgi:hypothetical protein
MRKEGGFTLLGLLFMLTLAACAALVSFKIVPAYMDYYTVRNVLQNILDEDVEFSNQSIRKTFAARINVNFIRDLGPNDLYISRDNGMLTLSVPISRKEHLVGGISVSVDLEATAQKPLKN